MKAEAVVEVIGDVAVTAAAQPAIPAIASTSTFPLPGIVFLTSL